MVARQLGEGVDHVSAERGVDVLREELAAAWPVLRPVGVVAHDLSTAVGCMNSHIVLTIK